MKMIERFDESSEFYTPERCYIVEIHNNEEDPGCSIARARVKPGVTTALHKLTGVIERYVILSGQGVVSVGDEPAQNVGPLDVVIIPANISQKITNTGREDLVFLCVCSPRFTVESYCDLE